MRARVQRLLAAWHSSLMQQVRAAPQGTPLARQQPFVAKTWDREMRKLLPQVMQQVLGGWGSATPWGLRQGLRVQQQQQQPQAQSQQQQQQQPQPQQLLQWQQATGLQLAATAAPAGGARRSARLHAHGTGQQAADKGSTSSDDEGSSSSSSESTADSDPTSSSGTSSGTSSSGANDSASSDNTGHGSDADEAWAELTATLTSLDDLLLPTVQPREVPVAGAAAAGSSAGPRQRGVMVAPWRPSASSLWRPVGPGQAAGAAGGAQSLQGDGAVGGSNGSGAGSSRAGGRGAAAVQEGPASCEPSWACLPAGMQLVLLQAARAGVAPDVLQRTFARLNEIVGDPQSHGNQA